MSDSAALQSSAELCSLTHLCAELRPHIAPQRCANDFGMAWYVLEQHSFLPRSSEHKQIAGKEPHAGSKAEGCNPRLARSSVGAPTFCDFSSSEAASRCCISKRAASMAACLAARRFSRAMRRASGSPSTGCSDAVLKDCIAQISTSAHTVAQDWRLQWVVNTSR